MDDKLLQELELTDVQLNTIIKNQVLIYQRTGELGMRQREKAAALPSGQGWVLPVTPFVLLPPF